MKSIPFLLVMFAVSLNACAQDKNNDFYSETVKTGDGCDGCEAVYDSHIPFENLTHVDTLPDFNETGPKLEITGVIYHADGTTPAKDIVMYLYHTDQNGFYSNKFNDTGWAKRHGYIRGWIKTNDKGEYKFYTLRPAPYPNATFPAHIHPTIKEPGKTPYWIDDYVFDGDKFVDDTYRSRAENRCGDGILKLVQNESGLFTANRDIILGLNIPDYK